MLCAIYKSPKKEGAYLYLQKRDDFSMLPAPLMALFGQPKLVMMVELERHRLAQVTVETVKNALLTQGFFLQLPPPTENLLEQYKQQKQAQVVRNQ